MKHISYLNIRSRLGMIRPPHGQTELNLGVELGGDAILEHKKKREFTASDPASVDPARYYEVIASEYAQIAQAITSEFAPKKLPIVVGGDHSVGFCSLIAVLAHHPAEAVGHLQIDSHADMNLVATSPTGNFHGMWLRPFFSRFDQPLIEALVPNKMLFENLLYLGNMDLDMEEVRLLTEKNIPVKASLTEVQHMVQKVGHLHLSLDIDAFDHSIAPATGIPAQSGLLQEDVQEILELVKIHPSLSIDLVEVNPQKEGAQKTIQLAQELLQTLLS